MFDLLAKLVVFILEGMKAPPDSSGGNPRPQTKKSMGYLAIVALIVFGVGYTAFEYELKERVASVKIDSEKDRKRVSALTAANSELKDKSIRMAAELATATKNLDRTQTELDMLRSDNLKKEEEIKRLSATIKAKENALVKLGLELRQLQELNDKYSNDTRRVWDVIVTLGEEDN